MDELCRKAEEILQDPKIDLHKKLLVKELITYVKLILLMSKEDNIMDRLDLIKNENGLTDEEKKQLGDALNTYMKGTSRETLSTDEINSLIGALNDAEFNRFKNFNNINAKAVEEAEERFREKLESGFFKHDTESNTSDDFEMLKYRSILIEAKNELEGYYIKDYYTDKIVYKVEVYRIEFIDKDNIRVIIKSHNNHDGRLLKYIEWTDPKFKEEAISYLGEKIL